MEINQIQFEKSSAVYTECPKTSKAEYAFIGRSNVGKSSLINMLARQKNLAKTSSQPGKTQLINHFIVNNHWYLVDLPGYGYAKVGKNMREKWEKTTVEYITKRENLTCVFVLIDSRIPPQKSDLEFMQFLGQNAIPFVIIFTKIDKLSKTQLEKSSDEFLTEMEKYWAELPPVFYSSATKTDGREDILRFIADTNKNITQ
jgi:GTP-binding protein